MANREVEAVAEQVLRSFGLWRLPVDPLQIAKEEDILLKPGAYDGKFDARIEYFPDFNRFCIFYRNEGTIPGRVRFSLAHELGHYYLPEHQARLRDKIEHFSTSDFRSRDPHEAEADEFAAALLMPRDLFIKKVKNFRQSVCDLRDLSTLAEQLQTSLTSTALRYCECDIEACTIIFSENGTIRWVKASTDMRYLRMSFVEGRNIPAGSKSEELLEEPEERRLDGEVDATVWFSRPQQSTVWEDTMFLGNTPYMLTLLTPG